jgi:uncharacterized protein (DUF362 family)
MFINPFTFKATMKRRDFIAAGTAAAAWLALGKYNWLNAGGNPVAPYDLVAVKNGNPVQMFDKAMQALGGMRAFVRPNQKVVVKPNIGWDVTPERAANTNPALVGRIVEQCLAAGAKEVYVFDNTCDQWEKCYKNSGIEKAVKEKGGKMAPGNAEGYYQQVTLKKGVSLKQTKVHELILGADVFINVPILKHHSSTELSIAMKNLMGIVYDRRYWHKNDLHQCIADFTTFSKPHLNVVDAFRVMMRHGPRGVSEADVTAYKSLIVSRDIVAADAAATKLFGTEPSGVEYMSKAVAAGVGSLDLEKLNIGRIKL